MENTNQQLSRPDGPLPDGIEQNFFTQFNSMIMTDREELIKQFQSMGEQLNHSTASFFLDMTNWNLQEAVGCYFDYMAQSRFPSMKFLSDKSVGKGEKITPSTMFHLTFVIQNNGETTWPSGTYIALKQDPNRKFYVPALLPTDTVSVTVQLVSPAEEGAFQTTWATYTPNGTEFGETITASREVCKTGTMSINQPNDSAINDTEMMEGL